LSHPYADREPQDSREAWALEAALSDGTISRRIVAFLLDGVFVLLVTGFLWLFCLLFGLLTFGLGWALFGVLPFVAPAYNWFWLSAVAATPGQAIMDLTVRDQDDLGQPGVLAALVWTVGFYASLALSGIPLLLALFNPRSRTAHDILSGLVVVRSRALTGWLGHWNISSGGPPAA
jgi:uncharacterized RDD family membrane protein YckC